MIVFEFRTSLVLLRQLNLNATGPTIWWPGLLGLTILVAYLNRRSILSIDWFSHKRSIQLLALLWKTVKQYKSEHFCILSYLCLRIKKCKKIHIYNEFIRFKLAIKCIQDANFDLLKLITLLHNTFISHFTHNVWNNHHLSKIQYIYFFRNNRNFMKKQKMWHIPFLFHKLFSDCFEKKDRIILIL